jgi:hypothetical protein
VAKMSKEEMDRALVATDPQWNEKPVLPGTIHRAETIPYTDSWKAELKRLDADLDYVKRYLAEARQNSSLELSKAHITVARIGLKEILHRVTIVEEGKYHEIVTGGQRPEPATIGGSEDSRTLGDTGGGNS